MKYYLIGGPVSTKKDPVGRDLGPQSRETVNAALFSRALQLHKEAPSGYSHDAHTLTMSKTCSQLRTSKSGHKLILCWVWLSDGSAHRAAWVLNGPENALYRSWQRVAWSNLVFRERRTHRQRRAS